MATLYSFMRKMLEPTTYSIGRTPTYAFYRGFILLDIPVRNKHTNYQRDVECYRPQVNYIILPTKQLLIGFTDNYIDLTKAALELSMKHLLDKQRAVLTAQHHLLNIGHIYKSPIPYAEQFPEQFI